MEDVKVGDYVILHVGYALQKIDPEEAQKTLALLLLRPLRQENGMKYITEYRDKELAKKLVADIAKRFVPIEITGLWSSCGAIRMSSVDTGLEGILPKNVRMIHGPGCPVCVMPIGRIDSAIELALEHGVILCTYADTMRVPASQGTSLMKAKAQGGDIRMIYSAADCLDIARANPDRNVVFYTARSPRRRPPWF